MSLNKRISHTQGWQRIPATVKYFLLKGILLFTTWKLLYIFVLLPNRVLDRPLTHLIGAGTAATLNIFSHGSPYSARPDVNNKLMDDGSVFPEPVMQVYWRTDKVLSIADVCNGLELMVLYAALLLALPGATSRKLIFIITGLLLINVMNILRCSALVLVFRHKPEYVNFIHHYVFNFVVYGVIFWLWLRYSETTEFIKKETLHAPIL
jgi:exosortase/archaeosortase family protein